MRKGLILLVTLLVTLLLSVLLLTRKELIISAGTTIRSSQNGLWRNLSDQAKWPGWWPADRAGNHVAGRPFVYNGYRFKIDSLLYNAVEISVENDRFVSNGKMVMIPLSTDSVLIHWQAALTATNNPFNRLQQYLRGKDIKNTMNVILDSLKAFNEDKKRMYRFNIHHTTLKDTALVATKKITKEYPSIALIYQMI